MAPKVDLGAWGQIFRSPGLMLLIATTGLQICGQLTFFVYLAPYFKTSLALTTAGVGWLFMWYGLANLVGNTVVARNIDRVGAARLSNLGIVITAAAMAAFLLGWESLALTMLLLALWGTASFAINSGMQTRLVGAAPWLAPAALPLNSTSIYLGQAAGAAIGGWLVSHDHLRSLPWVGAVFVVTAGLSSWAATRQPAPIRR
jgi:predicted MFS family arabinose efflux permease